MINEKVLKYQIHESNNMTTETKKEIRPVSSASSMYIIHRSLVKQMASKRQGAANTKTRSEVRGGGRKPWKQKGTGKARAGSIRSPLWRGGGVIFGPRPRKYLKKLNTKEKRLAIQKLLVNKTPQTLAVSETDLKLDNPRTQLICFKLNQLSVELSQRILIIVKNKNMNLYLASRNLHNVELVQADQINILSLLKAKKIITTREALLTIKETYNAR